MPLNYFNMENNALQVDYANWEAGKQYPEWMDEISLATISKGYLLPGEDVKKAYRRVANAAATRLKKPELSNKFFKIMWNGWLGLASPVLLTLSSFLRERDIQKSVIIILSYDPAALSPWITLSFAPARLT